MSAKALYQTLYQSDQLFRIPNERWSPGPLASVLADIPVHEPAPALTPTIDLISALDELAAQAPAPEPEAILVDSADLIVSPLPVDAPSVPLLITPEPLPPQAPRPTVPSVQPPAQNQARLSPINHKVLLLADEELDPSNLLFLEKILKAVNLNIDGVDLLNLHGVRDVDFAELVHGKKIHHFITFGVPFNRIHLDIAMDRYQPVRFFGITFLMADSLPTIEADQQLKKRLWAALQHIFIQR
ncbi:DNA polymerase III psi subunit [Spirosoma lacussanchae]|uniref:hypothetical protein n=1 Tax=Spirosoma lacussanchae TaxID=1884249 RepID=UPI0011096FF3|nr:hypothetical protein [Spirosoma lacussanchae]